MDSKLNNKIEKEIADFLLKRNTFICRNEKIVKVDHIHVNLNEEYAKNMDERIEFNGSAQVWLEAPCGSTSHESFFNGVAILKDVKVIDIEPNNISIKKL